MSLQDIRDLMAYNDWANGRFDDVLSTLAEEQWTRPLVSSFPSIRETRAHIAGSEWLWLERWRGINPSAMPDGWAGASFATLQGSHAVVVQERQVFLAGLAESALEARIAYTSLAGRPFVRRLGDLIRHMVNHSTYHRGQLTTLLRQVGAQPPSSDLVSFFPDAS